MPRPKPLPEPLASAPFSRSNALEAGLTDRRLRARDLDAPFHGVRLAKASEPPLEMLAWAYLVRMRRDSAFSHATAAMLRCLPLPMRFRARPLHVACPTPSRAPEGRAVCGHVIRADLWRRDELVLRAEPDALFALPVTSAPLTWLTMSSALGVPDLVALGDATLTRGLATRESLAVAVDSWGSGRGSRALRAALPELRYGVMSRPETLLRLQIADAGLPSPEINVPVFDRSGRLVFRPDLSWPEFRVLVEYEGDFHRTSRSKFRSDIERMEEFADAGWVALRVTGDDVFRDPNRFLGRLSRRLVSRGLRPRELRQVAAAQP